MDSTDPQTLRTLISNLSTLDDGQATDALEKIDKKAAKTTRHYIENAPRLVAQRATTSVAAAFRELAQSGRWEASLPKELAKASGSDVLMEVADRLEATAADPRNASEAAQALAAVERAMDKSPLLREAGQKALRKAEDQGLLGANLLARVVQGLVLAAVAGQMTAQAVSGNLWIVVGPVEVKVEDLERYTAGAKLGPIGPLSSSQVSATLGPDGEKLLRLASTVPITASTGFQLGLKPELRFSDQGAQARLAAQIVASTRAGGKKGLVVEPYAQFSRGEKEGGLAVTARFGGTEETSRDRLPAVLVAIALILVR